MTRQIIHYSPGLKERACQLRENSTLAEILLWKERKQKQIRGRDFHRQKPIGEFIVDFYCPELRLAIEIDGESHAGKEKEDVQRQEKLEQLGVHVLRFDDLEVKLEMESVLARIRRWIDEHSNEE